MNSMTNNIINFEEILKGFSEIQVKNNAYLTAVTALQSTLTNLKGVKLPEEVNFKNAPADYQKIKSCYEAIQKECTTFTIDIHTQLVNYPNTCLRSLNDIDTSIASAIDNVDNLMKSGLSDYEKENLTAKLTNNLEAIISQSETQINSLNILTNNLNKYIKTNLVSLKKNLEDLTALLAIDSAKFSATLVQLEQTQKTLEKEIADLIAGIASGSAGIFASIIIGILSVVVVVSSGGTALPIAVAGVSAFLAVAGFASAVAYNSARLVSDQKELERLIGQMSGYEVDILLLNSTKDNFSSFVSQMDDVLRNLITIRDAWRFVSDGFTNINITIKAAAGKIETEDWQKIKAALEACQTTSENTRTMLNDLKIEDTKVSKANLKVGMSQSEVEKAIQSSKQVSFEEFMLAI